MVFSDKSVHMLQGDLGRRDIFKKFFHTFGIFYPVRLGAFRRLFVTNNPLEQPIKMLSEWQ